MADYIRCRRGERLRPYNLVYQATNSTLDPEDPFNRTKTDIQNLQTPIIPWSDFLGSPPKWHYPSPIQRLHQDAQFPNLLVALPEWSDQNFET